MPEFDSSAFWGIAGIVVGIIVATIFFLLGKKKTLLQYNVFTTPLITEKMAGILDARMTIDGQPVKSLTSTTISFVNSGNQRIRSSDFSTQEPLRVILKGHLYGCDVSRGNQKLLPNIEPVNDNVLNISFENLKPRQFFRVTILHDKSLNVVGELTTGTMHMYGHSTLPTYLFFAFLLGLFALIADYEFNGPVSTLIGTLGSLAVIAILLFVTLFIFVVDEHKDHKIKKLMSI